MQHRQAAARNQFENLAIALGTIQRRSAVQITVGALSHAVGGQLIFASLRGASRKGIERHLVITLRVRNHGRGKSKDKSGHPPKGVHEDYYIGSQVSCTALSHRAAGPGFGVILRSGSPPRRLRVSAGNQARGVRIVAQRPIHRQQLQVNEGVHDPRQPKPLL